MPKVQSLLIIARAAFWLTLVFTFVEAVIAPAHALRIFSWDKAEHFAAFYTLTGLALVAFPTRSWAIIAVALVGFGGTIEIVQSLPIVGRDCDIRDWGADIIAVAAVLLPAAAVWWRDIYSDHAMREGNL